MISTTDLDLHGQDQFPLNISEQRLKVRDMLGVVG